MVQVGCFVTTWKNVEAAETEVCLHSLANYMVNERAEHSLLNRIKLNFLCVVPSVYPWNPDAVPVLSFMENTTLSL